MEEINNYRLDKVDRKIIYSIEADAHIPISELARKTRTSRTVAEYRLKQLEKRGIIRGYYCLLDPSKFGITVWKLWISLRPTSPDELKQFFFILRNIQESGGMPNVQVFITQLFAF